MPLRQQPTFERALADPKSVYKVPKAVLADASMSTQQKRKILMQWEHDARLIQVAEEEAMSTPGTAPEAEERSMLRDVRLALQEIDGPADEKPGAPTKFGASS